MFKKKKKTKFINLAEQLAIENDIVSSTVDSMIQFVSEKEDIEQRSDFQEIQKTAGDCELNPNLDFQEKGTSSLPRPKMPRVNQNATQKETI